MAPLALIGGAISYFYDLCDKYIFFRGDEDLADRIRRDLSFVYFDPCMRASARFAYMLRFDFEDQADQVADEDHRLDHSWYAASFANHRRLLRTGAFV